MKITNEKDLALAKEEFARDRDLWTNLLVTRRFYYADLLTRVVERQNNHTLAISTIAIAVVSIAFPIINTSSLISAISFILLSISAFLGILLVLYTIFVDQNYIPKIKEKELDVYSKFQAASTKNYNKSVSSTLTIKDVEDYFGLKKDIEKSLQSESDSIFRKLAKFSNYIYYLFLLIFIVGMSSFLYLIFSTYL